MCTILDNFYFGKLFPHYIPKDNVVIFTSVLFKTHHFSSSTPALRLDSGVWFVNQLILLNDPVRKSHWTYSTAVNWFSDSVGANLHAWLDVRVSEAECVMLMGFMSGLWTEEPYCVNAWSWTHLHVSLCVCLAVFDLWAASRGGLWHVSVGRCGRTERFLQKHTLRSHEREKTLTNWWYL